MTSSKSNPRKKDTDTTEIAVDLGSLTHVGMVRSANQDAYGAILAPNTPPGIDALLAVADGMGGHQAGEVASAMAIQGLVRRLSPQDAKNVTPLPPGRARPTLLETFCNRSTVRYFRRPSSHRPMAWEQPSPWP